jgi:SAM-dependent methyltransferase
MFRDRDRKKCQELFDKHYAGRKFSRGQYQDLIRQNVAPGTRLLDAGCGRYLEFSRELANNVQVVGIDLEEQLDTKNRSSPYAIRGDLGHLPFPSNYFDVVISRSVIEHLSDPPLVFQEMHRVLKPGGKVILSTPNKWDYISVAARLTPYSWHRALVSKMLGVSEDDVFPTLYRANTLAALGHELQAAGFKENVLRAVSHYPAYLMFSPMLFRLGMLYERLVSLQSFHYLRGTLLCVFEKSGAERDTGGVAREGDFAREVGV